MVGKKLMHAKGGAGRKTGRRRGTKAEDEEREGKGEERGRKESTRRVYGRHINRRERRRIVRVDS